MTSGHPTVVPSISYRDAAAAIEFLVDACGFQKKAAYSGAEHGDSERDIVHAELTFGDGMAMLASSRSQGDPLHRAPGSASVYVVVEDVDAHFEHAKAAGAEIVREPTDQDYGGRDYGLRDPEGNTWSFGTYDPFAEQPG